MPSDPKKVLILGANGFIGTAVYKKLKIKYKTMGCARGVAGDFAEINLLDRESIETVIAAFEPDVIVNCAGVVENNENAKMNLLFTQNLLEAVKNLGLKPKVIICGSSATYGVVGDGGRPINENQAQKPTSLYAISKKQEEDFALKFSQDTGLNIIVLRIFNPIGAGMKGRFLIPKILEQIELIRSKQASLIVVNRLDATRDFLDARDLARAVDLLITANNNHHIYNIGSGKQVTVKKLIENIIEVSGIRSKVILQQESDQTEPLYASWADIRRIYEDTGWVPEYNLKSTVKEIVRETIENR